MLPVDSITPGGPSLAALRAVFVCAAACVAGHAAVMVAEALGLGTLPVDVLVRGVTLEFPAMDGADRMVRETFCVDPRRGCGRRHARPCARVPARAPTPTRSGSGPPAACAGLDLPVRRVGGRDPTACTDRRAPRPRTAPRARRRNVARRAPLGDAPDPAHESGHRPEPHRRGLRPARAGGLGGVRGLLGRAVGALAALAPEEAVQRGMLRGPLLGGPPGAGGAAARIAAW